MRISEILKKETPYETFTFEVDGYVISIFIRRDDQVTIPLNEAKQKGISLGGQYSALRHTVPEPGKEHIHVYAKGNDIFALNKDGTAHDQSHGVKIPNRVADAIRTHFPNFSLPPNNFIESAPTAIELSYKMQVLVG
ncbi:MAG: hypothetical protein PHD65_06175 [Gallionella sp.]|nr:hypothetical protein [Gallionella sp.]